MSNETNASEPSGASAGSHGKPVVWAAMHGDVAMYTSRRRESVSDIAARYGREIVPLYRSPTLTDEERAAIEQAVKWYDNMRAASTLRALLERLK